MNITASIKLKAAILLVVFASNSVLGFACAVGLDTDLLQRLIHHNEVGKATESAFFVHASGKNGQHTHEKKTSKRLMIAVIRKMMIAVIRKLFHLNN